MLIKNMHYEMKIDDIGSQGEGIGRIDNIAVFVDGTVPGDEIEVRIVKVKKRFAYGKFIRMIKESENRQLPACKDHLKCGGCRMQHITYPFQLKWKTKKVYDALTRIGLLENVHVNDTIGMETPYYYRNKAQFPVVAKGSDLITGFYAARSHTIVEIDECCIQHKVNTAILKKVKAYMFDNHIQPYDENSHTGLVRHVLTRVSFANNEVMVYLVINGKALPKADAFIESLSTIPHITSIGINLNTQKTNVILGDQTHTLWGKPFITDKIGDVTFAISPVSFFQVNPIQTKILYDTVLQFADLTGNETIIDAYCGIGSISLYLAKKAKKIIGVEIVPQAIEDAKQNMLQNNISNAEFLLGKSEEILPQLAEQKQVYADILIVDPPRKGCDPELLNAALLLNPEKIIYVSCDPATLARDLTILTQGNYRVVEVQPVDLFPMTVHVETVVLMSKKDS